VTILVILFFLSVTRPGRTVAPILTLNGSNDVFRPKEVPFGGQDDGWRHMGKIFPKNSPKGAWIGSFKPKRQNLYIVISPELLIRQTSDLRSEFRPRKALREWSAITPKQIQHGWRPPSWKSIWRHISVAYVPIWTKFGSRMRNDTPITEKWSRSKPEVEFQYGGLLFFKTGSSYISAANWDIWTKFGLLIDFDLLTAVTSTNTKPEVVFSGSGRHLEKWIWCHISAVGAPIWTKFGSLMQNNMQITVNWSISKSEVQFQYGGCLYFETGSSYISAAIWDISIKFGLLIDFDLLKAVTSTDMKPTVVFSCSGRHLEKLIWHHISAVLRFGQNSVAWCRITCRLQRTGRDRNQK